VTKPPLSLIQPRAPRILLVDDDPEVVSGLRRMLKAAEPSWEIRTAKNGREALELVEAELIDVIVTDLNMPEVDGFQLLRRMERSHPETIRIVHSSHTATLAQELLRFLAHNVVPKPTAAAEMLTLLRWAVRAAGGVLRHVAER
jgi:YesN/AraC family two-component response regulator